MTLPHLGEVLPDALGGILAAAGLRYPTALAERLFRRVHQHGALAWEDLGLKATLRHRLAARLAFGPRLSAAGERIAADGTRKFLWRLADGEAIETVLLRNLKTRTLCLSSQAGCALRCAFCATGRLGLRRDLAPGEIVESARRSARAAGVRASDVVFMGQGEPLHNYDGVVHAARLLADRRGASISPRRITLSTAGLVPQILRFAREGQPWRLHVSLHSAVQETRERLMPIARVYPIPELVAALRELGARRPRRWITLQYVAIPGVNMDEAQVDALERELGGLRYILNVIPYNDAGPGFRAPTWREVKDFTTRLRRLGCPVKVRYSGGKREGMGCGQLSAERLPLAPTGGHVLAPPGIFSDVGVRR